MDVSPAGVAVDRDRPPDPHERLFVILTRPEAEAAVTLGETQRRTPAALRALAKIRAALSPALRES